MKSEKDALQKIVHESASELYPQPDPNQAGQTEQDASGETASADGKDKKDDVVDAEYTEVKEEKTAEEEKAKK